MEKRPVNPEWFNYIYRHNLHRMDIVRGFEWLKQLSESLSRIANFGCWNSDEPFALLWTLDAADVVVIEKEERHLETPKKTLETLTNTDCMFGRTIEFITADMSADIAQLSSDFFDLVYCKDVLYYLYDEPNNHQKLHRAIYQMMRVVRPGGFVVAVEAKMGAEITCVDPLSEQISGTEDISPLFERVGLLKIHLDNQPEYSYCYQKPSN